MYAQSINRQTAEILSDLHSKADRTAQEVFKKLLEHRTVQDCFKIAGVDPDALIPLFEASGIKEPINIKSEVLTRYISKAIEKLGDLYRFPSSDEGFAPPALLIGLIKTEMGSLFNSIIGQFYKPEEFTQKFREAADEFLITKWDGAQTIGLPDFLKEIHPKDNVGRDEILSEIIQVLLRKTKGNPVLVGPAGVGKTAIVEKLAYLLQEPEAEVPASLRDRKILEVDLGLLVNSVRAPEAITQIVEYALATNSILFMDEMHLLAENEVIMNMLKPEMARGLNIIGATTDNEFHELIKDKAWLRRVQKIRVEEPEDEELYEILQLHKKETEEHTSLFIDNAAILSAITLSKKFIKDRNQPDAAIDLIEEAAAKLKLRLENKPKEIIEHESTLSKVQTGIKMLKARRHNRKNDFIKIARLEQKAGGLKNKINELAKKFEEDKRLYRTLLEKKEELRELESAKATAIQAGLWEKAAELIWQIDKIVVEIEEIETELRYGDHDLDIVVKPETISLVIEDRTGVPASAQEDNLKKIATLEQKIGSEIKGQDHAILEVGQAIKRGVVGLIESTKPQASFMFLGPTGVGKTYLAKKLSKFLFGHEKILRFDMSEYMEPHSVSRFIGSPPGYVGHDDGGQLTNAVRENPYSVVLFDEVEKAHPKIFDSLLQVLDDGRLTDGQGETVDFTKTIIIMTSNIGAELIQKGIKAGHTFETIESGVISKVEKKFRPEFLNRIDSKIVFKPLNKEAIHEIAEVELQKLAERIEAEKEIVLEWDEEVIEHLVEMGFDPVYGARPLKRAINESVVALLTEGFINGTLESGAVASFDIEKGKLVLDVI